MILNSAELATIVCPLENLQAYILPVGWITLFIFWSYRHSLFLHRFSEIIEITTFALARPALLKFVSLTYITDLTELTASLVNHLLSCCLDSIGKGWCAMMFFDKWHDKSTLTLHFFGCLIVTSL